jgi:hypothetical protein
MERDKSSEGGFFAFAGGGGLIFGDAGARIGEMLAVVGASEEKK